MTFRTFALSFLMINSKSGLLDIIDNCFFHKNGKGKFSYIVVCQQKYYFVKYHSDSSHKYCEVKIKKMLEFFLDNIYVIVSNSLLEFLWVQILPLC
jgi:hypothetical protein